MEMKPSRDAVHAEMIADQVRCNPRLNSLIGYHDRLDACTRADLNENFIERKLDELERIGGSDPLFFLTLARIAELTLYCAGIYADAIEFRAVGDLLFNPRQTAIHLKGRHSPLLKKRHCAITDHFAADHKTRRDTLVWIRKNAILEVKSKPLLPHVYDRLKDSGHMAEGYIDSIDRRMIQVTEAVGFLSAYRAADSASLYRGLQFASDADRKFLGHNLCRFTLDAFFDLGMEFRKIVDHPGCKSKFLAHRQ
jgi:hypothetical protein